jgi:hypothetical protein
MEHPFSFEELKRLRADLRSHIPGDATWTAAVSRFLGAHVDALAAAHPDNPVNKRADDADAGPGEDGAEVKAREPA